MSQLSSQRVFFLLLIALVAISSEAAAQTGVSDDRVSLPEGPGSLEGVGENVGINPNMGSMSYNIPIDVTPGFPAVTPGIALSYSSSNGNSVAGMGWSMDIPNIERMTFRGLPQYNRTDDFSMGGSSELVQVSSDPPVYRARYEGGFMRYTWLDAGDGTEGYWLVEDPDGSKSYFGADSEGNTVSNARVSGDQGTFRYMLVEKVDVHGHKIRYTYEKDGHVSLIHHIGYVFADGENPTYEVEFDYEERRDETRADYLSDAKAGFNELLTQRLTDVRVKSRGAQIRRYALSYEPYANSGGFTRMNRVARYGARDTLYPAVFDFQYSHALGNDNPVMVDMGTLGVNLQNGRATLIDINGDALPDIIDSSNSGPHRFYLNEANLDGTSSFNTAYVSSSVGTRSSHALEGATVQVLDANGDGFTDIVNAATGQILVNKGNGDWEESEEVDGTSELAEAFNGDFNTGEGEFQAIKFLDYNNDKKIDVVLSTSDSTTIYQNKGTDGFEVDEDIESIGLGFAEDGAQFADMNGDGILDVVRVQPNSIRYKLNLGWGKWDEWVIIEDLPISEQQVELAELEDINGDGLADLVVVFGSSVTYSLNTNTTEFSSPVQLTGESIGADIPVRDSSTSVLYADMNANGSSDVVWINAQGHVQYLELFPVRPNLMTQVTNALGMVTDVTYTTSVQQMARDGGAGAWQYKLPYPMNIVEKVDRYDLLTNLHEEDIYSYRDGFYDGLEKQFRGFERVEIYGPSDETQEEQRITMEYEVGAEDSYRKDLLLSRTIESDGRVLRVEKSTYEDCNLAGIPEGTSRPIRYICPTSTETVVQEGQDESAWLTTRTESEYDGYGNITTFTDHGIYEGTCAPCGDRPDEQFGLACGDACLGDEMSRETAYVSPENTNDRWILNAPYRTRTYGREGVGPISEKLTYYDGNPFEGLPLGNLDKALVTRITEKVYEDSDSVIETQRMRYDDHGNLVELLDPLATLNGNDHRRTYTYDEENLRVTSSSLHLEDQDGNPYQLRRTISHETLFDRPSTATEWVLVENDEVLSTRRGWSFVYDEFGRLTERYYPGNNSTTPDTTYTYDLASPSSRIIAESRSAAGGDLDIKTVRCVDGRGRTYQTRHQTDNNTYLVTGFQRFNLRSAPVEEFLPYTSSSDACDQNVPAGTLATTFKYDAANRIKEITVPDADIYGSASVTRTEYEPFVSIQFDHEDNNPGGPYANTPTRSYSNGLNQTTRIERTLKNGDVASYSLRFDGLGRITHVIDPEGNVKEQYQDLLSRVTRIVDPNSANDTTFEYDDAGNIIRLTDDRGVVRATSYDGSNRPKATWNEADPENTRIEWTYDKTADCASCTNAEGRTATVSYPGLDGTWITDEYGYDIRNREVHFSRHFGDKTLTFGIAYDNANRPTSMTYPDGQTIEKVFDQNGRVVQIPGILSAISYDDQGQISSVVRADGTESVITYDDLMRTETMDLMGGGQTLQGFGFTRDRNNNLEQVANRGNVGLSHQATFEYDAWYRLLTADYNGTSMSFEHDNLDRLLSTSAHGAFSYDSYAPNALTEGAGKIFDYDAAGNVTQRGDQSMTWDFMNRMTSVEQNGEAIARFVYGANQSRVLKQEGSSTVWYIGRDFEVRDGISTLYLRVDGRRSVRIQNDALATSFYNDNGDNEINAGDAWIASGDEKDQILASALRRLMVETGADDGVTFFHHDNLGSLTLATGLVDGELTVLGERSFSPLGEEHASVGYVDEYGFTGQEIDHSTGLIHFDWRYYDPQVGRWLSIDPSFATTNADNITKLGESTTAYNYVAGNFMNYNDPTGLGAKAVAKAIGRFIAKPFVALGKAVAKGWRGLGNGGDTRTAAQIKNDFQSGLSQAKIKQIQKQESIDKEDAKTELRDRGATTVSRAKKLGDRSGNPFAKSQDSSQRSRVDSNASVVNLSTNGAETNTVVGSSRVGPPVTRRFKPYSIKSQKNFGAVLSDSNFSANVWQSDIVFQMHGDATDGPTNRGIVAGEP